jgi:hypothetical protein
MGPPVDAVGHRHNQGRQRVCSSNTSQPSVLHKANLSAAQAPAQGIGSINITKLDPRHTTETMRRQRP